MKAKDSANQANRQRWGVPDWRNAALYPKANNPSLTYWRWEFLRRDGKYRDEWSEYRSQKHPFRLSVDGDPDDAGFDIPYYPEEHEDSWGDIWRILRKYGLTRLLDPSIAAPKCLRFHFVPFAADLKDNPELRNLPIKEVSIPWKLKYPYLAWFDLSKAIPQQIRHYESLLIKEQAIALELLARRSEPANVKRKSIIEAEIKEAIGILEGRVSKRAARSLTPAKRSRYALVDPKWPRWLRVLDARAEKASWGAIGNNTQKNKHDVSIAARNDHKAAKTLWWKIPIERSLGPLIGMEEARLEDSYSVLPRLETKNLFLDWFDKLPPNLSKILVSSLS